MRGKEKEIGSEKRSGCRPREERIFYKRESYDPKMNKSRKDAVTDWCLHHQGLNHQERKEEDGWKK